MLETRKLSKQYGAVTALSDLDLIVNAGEIYCLLGANGAGKTTTINLLLGFIAPSAGQALVGGVDVANDAAAARRLLAYIPETVMLYGALTGVENLQYFTSLSGHEYSDEELRRLLLGAGLSADAHDRAVRQYSKGMRQKVGVAIAIAKRSRALLLDEPTSGLDPH
ncbi:MAG: ABC transporter ATP-binding protein, partial [Steroidobacteraceae bacterium]|nr:ABC transporter ATP-binding protein [Steroidobacteraceae bacterium]MDW8258981.1 ABC transporter ATP-binding protein [Gammaproteobacteria bacterium]